MKLELIHLTKSYNGKQAVKDFSAVLTPGVYGLLGPNGAGKSSLMAILSASLLPDDGRVLFEGEEIGELGKAYRQRLGWMPQQQELYDSFTGSRFLWYMAALKGIKKARAKERIEKLLELVNLEKAAGQRIGGYSGGMKQRLLIAQAMLNDPDVLILDEPTAGLDPGERIRIRNFISEMGKEKIVLLATHVVSDIEFIAKEVMLMKDGMCIRMASIPELLKEIEYKVFEGSVAEKDLPALEGAGKISGLNQEIGTVGVRLVADRPPEGYSFRPVRPRLEDLYIYLYNDKGTNL